MWLQPCPEVVAVLDAPLGNRVVLLDRRQHQRQLAGAFGASRTRGHVCARVRCLAVMLQDEIVVRTMGHASLRSGSSASRSFRTARNTACLAALCWTPSASPMSSMLFPSWWR